jgi:hypothetical protein
VARDLREALAKDLASVDPKPMGPKASAGLSCVQPVAVLAIGRADSGPPKVIIDLSHTAWLGPDYRDY